jgi:hypothetical protein
VEVIVTDQLLLLLLLGCCAGHVPLQAEKISGEVLKRVLPEGVKI